MRVVGRIYKWIIISIVLQVIVLIFFNNFYLTSKRDVKVTMSESTGDTRKDVSGVEIPQNASDIKVSFDNSYVAYLLNGKLEIIDINSKKSVKTISHDKEAAGKDNPDKAKELIDKGIITYYRWVPDRNMVIYALKAPDDMPGRVQMVTYDIATEIEHIYPQISRDLPKGSSIVSVELSTLTNVLYPKIKVSDKEAKLYKFNIMDEVSYIMNTSLETVFKKMTYSDILVYQDNKNRIFVRDGIKYSTRELNFKGKMVLLGLDAEDKIYVGELNDQDKVTKIYSGKHDEDPGKQWTQLPLKSPVSAKDVIVSGDGTVYELAEGTNTILNVQNNSKTVYKGKFIELVNGYIVSIDKNELKLTLLNDGSGE